MKKCFLFIFVPLILLRTGIANAQMDDRFYFPNKEWSALDSLKYEEILLSTDTVKLSGILLKPTHKPKATILFFHGAGGNVTRYTFMTSPLVNQGFQVLMIDFRGYGKSTGKPTHLNIAHDGQVVLDYLLKRKDVRNTPIILYGASMGTQIAVKLARDNQDKIKALVLDGTISSFTDIAADRSPVEQQPMIRQNLLSPYSAKEDIRFIEKMPKLFIHSQQDKEVPFQEAEVVYANAKEPKSFFTYEGKHLEVMKTSSQAVIARIEQLLKQ